MNAAVRLVEVRVPDMGNFKDVAVIDVLVKPGERVEPDTPLVTLETEKATMDVPSTAGGVIEKIHVAKGGTVSPGDLIVTLRTDGAPGAAARPAACAAATAPPAPAATPASPPAEPAAARPVRAAQPPPAAVAPPGAVLTPAVAPR